MVSFTIRGKKVKRESYSVFIIHPNVFSLQSFLPFPSTCAIDPICQGQNVAFHCDELSGTLKKLLAAVRPMVLLQTKMLGNMANNI